MCPGFHKLRHLFAVEYLKDDGNTCTLMGLLGHSSIKTTVPYLRYLTPEEAERAKYSTAQH